MRRTKIDKKSSHVISVVVSAISKGNKISREKERDLQEQVKELEKFNQELIGKLKFYENFFSIIGLDNKRLLDMFSEDKIFEDTMRLAHYLHALQIEIDTQHPNLRIHEEGREWAISRLEELLIPRKEDHQEWPSLL